MPTRDLLLLELLFWIARATCLDEEQVEVDKLLNYRVSFARAGQIVESLNIPTVTQAYKEFRLQIMLDGQDITEEDNSVINRFYSTILVAVSEFLEEASNLVKGKG